MSVLETKGYLVDVDTALLARLVGAKDPKDGHLEYRNMWWQKLASMQIQWSGYLHRVVEVGYPRLEPSRASTFVHLFGFERDRGGILMTSGFGARHARAMGEAM